MYKGETAWQRLLRQVEAQKRLDREAMAKEEEAYQEELRQAEEIAPGEAAVRGGQMGMAAGGPWGALIGAGIGKGAASIEYGKKHGFPKGLAKFLDPTITTKALLTTPEGQQRGASIAGAFGKTGARGGTTGRTFEDARKMEDMRARGMSPAMGRETRYGAAPQKTPSEETSRFQFQTDEEVARAEALDAALEEDRRKKRGV